MCTMPQKTTVNTQCVSSMTLSAILTFPFALFQLCVYASMFISHRAFGFFTQSLQWSSYLSQGSAPKLCNTVSFLLNCSAVKVFKSSVSFVFVLTSVQQSLPSHQNNSLNCYCLTDLCFHCTRKYENITVTMTEMLQKSLKCDTLMCYLSLCSEQDRMLD